MDVLYLVLFLVGSRLCGVAGVITFSKEPGDVIYHQRGFDAFFDWDYEETNELRSTIWRVYNKTKSGYDVLRLEDDRGMEVQDPDIPPAAYVGRIGRKGRAGLIIKNVTFEDSTLFKCTLTEKVTLRPTESSVDLQVTGPCRTNPSVQFVVDGNLALFNCSATGVPSQNFTWKRPVQSSTIAKNDAKYSISSVTGSSQLTIKSISGEDEGYYVCDTTVNVNEPCENSGFLQLRFIREEKECGVMRSYNLAIGKNLTIGCPVSGYPPPVISWKKNGILLPEQSTELTVTFAKEDNFGNYTCTATNFQTVVGPCAIRVVKEAEPAMTSQNGTDKNPATMKWAKVLGANYYVVKIMGADIHDDFVIGARPSLEIHYNSLVMKNGGNPDVTVIHVEVEAITDSECIRTLPKQPMTIVKPAKHA